MATRDDFSWFKETFHRDMEAAIAGTPFTIDLLAAIAAQETGRLWTRLRGRLPLPDLLEICVGDTLDADKGRSAFPRTRDELLAVPRGQEMFQIAHEALVRMAQHDPGYAGVARRPQKFCHAFGVFQYDLQHFRTDPDYFLEQRWRSFDASVAKCIESLTSAMARIGLAGRSSLTDLERVQVAIAYNAGSFRPSRGLQQGFFDGTKYYGEMIFDFLRTSQTAATSTRPALIPPPRPGAAPLAPPTPVASTGQLFEVDVRDTPLRLRREPVIDRARPNANVIASLPDGHLVRHLSGKRTDTFMEVETSLNGALLRGFAASAFLVPVRGRAELPPIVVPAVTPPSTGIVAVEAPKRPGTLTRRIAPANALSLNEAGQPGRQGATPEELREELSAIIDYLAVDRLSHVRYRPRSGVTFCNIYAHDYCHLAGVYLPRVWWTPDAIERLAQGERVDPRLESTVDEQRANDLFRWLRAFGPRFGWRQTGTLTKLQMEANAGAVALIIARRTVDGKSGHVAMVVPESPDFRARRDAAGEVVAPLQSQAGTRNFKRETAQAGWWAGEQFADHAFWVHA